MDALGRILGALVMVLMAITGPVGAERVLPIITEQPDSETIFVGGVASFSVTVESDSTPSYLWQYSPTGVSYGSLPTNGAMFFGQAEPVLTIDAATQSVQGVYRCAVTNATGTTFSDGAPLFVQPIPAALKLEPAELSVFAIAGQSFPQATLTIINEGGLSLNFSFSAPLVSWHNTPSPSSGLVPPAPSALGVSIGFDNSLPIGIYETTLTLTSNAIGAEITTIPLRLQVVDAYTVTTLADSGPGSLRAILQSCNSTPGPQTVKFAVSGQIEPLTALPPLSDNTGGTTIDAKGAGIVLNGQLIPDVVNGLVLTSANNKVEGLQVVGFRANGILVAGLNAVDNSITGCRIGPDSKMVRGNLQAGIRIDDGAAGTNVGGPGEEANTISGNSFSAILIGRAERSNIRGNNIGAGKQSFELVGNGGHGVHFLPRISTVNAIGGQTIFDINTNAGSKFRPTSIDALVGSNVKLRGLAQGPGTHSYKWFFNGAQIGTSQELLLTNVQKSQEGDYTYEVSNTAGGTKSPTAFVNVLDRKEFFALALLPVYSELDVNADGGISFSEAAFFASRALSEVSRGGEGMTQEDFDAIDTDGDGLISVAELVIAAEIETDLLRFQVTPESLEFADRDIDDGPSAEQVLEVVNVDSELLHFVSSPAAAGPAAGDFAVVEDNELEALDELQRRTMSFAFDPSNVNTKVAYLVIRTDDFQMPVITVPFHAEGFQTTLELLAKLLGANPAGWALQELDVNADVLFDGSDIETNVNAGR